MSPASKAVLHDLLYSAVIEIRAATEPHGSEDDKRFANLLAYLVHDWPQQLGDASTSDEYDSLLRDFWSTRDTRTDPWMRDRLNFLGVDPDQFG